MVAVAQWTRNGLAGLDVMSPTGSIREAILQARSEELLYRREADGFAAVTPPAEVEADHAFLIRDDRAFAAQWMRLARFLAHPSGGRPPVPVGAGFAARARVLSDLRAKGYDLGPITGRTE